MSYSVDWGVVALCGVLSRAVVCVTGVRDLIWYAARRGILKRVTRRWKVALYIAQQIVRSFLGSR